MKMLLLISLIFTSFNSVAEWLDFENVKKGQEYNYKPYQASDFEVKASRYFKPGSLLYYDFMLVANIGDSNYGENYLSVDFGNESCVPGMSIRHKDGAPFNLSSIDIGSIFQQDGDFMISLLGLDENAKPIVEQLVHIDNNLQTILLTEEFLNINQLLVNAVYVKDIDNSVARFAVDNLIVSLSEQE